MADSSVITQEFTVRMSKNINKRYNVMRFRATPDVDISTWTHVRMKREDNNHESKPEEVKPKYGAGSEYGREKREEARRKKYSGKVDKGDKPWILEIEGKKRKKYRGIKSGGFSDNSSYFVFIKSQDGSIDAYPIEDWTNFAPMPTHKTLNEEEAEEQFGKKETKPILNYFAIMKGNLKTDMEEKSKKEDTKSISKKSKNCFGGLKIVHNPENQDSDCSEKDENEEKSIKKPKRKEKKVKTESDVESVESDEGDRDGKDVEVMSSSDEEETVLNMSESEEETEKDVKKVEKIAVKDKIEKKSSSSESSGDDSDEYDKNGDPIIRSVVFLQSSKEKKLDIKELKQGKALKRKIKTPKEKPPAKKVKIENQEVSSELTSDFKKSSKKVMPIESIRAPNVDLSSEINVKLVKQYLMRKPLTATELIKKFKKKNNSLNSTEIVHKVAQIMKVIDLQQTIVDGKTFFSMKSH